MFQSLLKIVGDVGTMRAPMLIAVAALLGTASVPAWAVPPARTPAMPTLRPDPRRQSPMLVPEGWTVSRRSDAGTEFLALDERPGVPDSPQLGLIARPVAAGATPDVMLAAVLSSLKDARPLESHVLGKGSGRLVVVDGTVGGIPARVAVIAISDGRNAFAAYLAAPRARFDTLGGLRLLFASLQMQDPRPQPEGGRVPQTKALPPSVAIQRYDVQLALLANRRPVPPATIVGNWTQGMAVPAGDAYRNVVSGEINYDSLGHGSYLRLAADGSYTYLYNYAQTMRACRNSLQRTETGRYTFDGSTLVLKPREWDSTLCACCSGKPTHTRHKGGELRRYDVAFHPSGQHMVIKGTCPKIYLSCLGEETARYLREGFSRE